MAEALTYKILTALVGVIFFLEKNELLGTQRYMSKAVTSIIGS